MNSIKTFFDLIDSVKGIYNEKVHVDYPNMKTAAFYINTNNGYTKFRREWGDWAVVNGYPEDPDHERIVESRSNRMVIFDSNLEHSGYTCTDEKVRVLVNFNYEGN